jgi:hypothetical protein
MYQFLYLHVVPHSYNSIYEDHTEARIRKRKMDGKGNFTKLLHGYRPGAK